MNYYEKIIQEKKNYKIFGMDGDQYESRHISEYARKFADGLKKGLISESQIVTNLIIDYGWSRKNAEKVAEQAKKIARHNSKEEKDNENFHYLGKTFSVTSGNYKDVRKQIEQTYKDAVAKLERKISSATGSEKSKLEAELREVKSGYKETLEEFDWGFGNEKEKEKGYYAKLAEEKNSNPYYSALSLIKDKHSVNDMVRELTSNYGVSKSEALHAIEKAAKDSHEAEIEKKARELY